MTMVDGSRRSNRPLVAPSRQAAASSEGAHPARVRTDMISAGRTIGLTLLALLMAALLCADSLVQVAERQSFGTTRDVALAAARPLRSVSHAFGLHLPRLWLAEATGNDLLPTSAAGKDIEVPSVTIPTTAPPMSKPSGTPTTTPTTVPTTTTLPVRRTPTAEDPLRVVMFGDSLMGHLAVGFGRHVRDEPRLHLYTEYHVGTGLARPDVLDWPAYLAQILPGFNPEVIYLAFGGNDDQAMQGPDGAELAYGTPEWHAEYTRRVALTMDVAAQNDRTVVWLGMPAHARERLNGARAVMNQIGQEQATLRPRVVYVDLSGVLTPQGVFTETITAPDGSTVRVREGDGVHVSVPGGEYVAPTLLAAIATDWHLVAPAAPPPTAPPTTPPRAPPG